MIIQEDERVPSLYWAKRKGRSKVYGLLVASGGCGEWAVANEIESTRYLWSTIYDSIFWPPKVVAERIPDENILYYSEAKDSIDILSLLARGRRYIIENSFVNTLRDNCMFLRATHNDPKWEHPDFLYVGELWREVPRLDRDKVFREKVFNIPSGCYGFQEFPPNKIFVIDFNSSESVRRREEKERKREWWEE